MIWKYVKPLATDNSISDFEQKSGYQFEKEFVKCAFQNNGGRVTPNSFDTDQSEGRQIKSLLSFNKDDKVNIWDANGWNSESFQEQYVAFAIDNFGNLICFSKKDNKVVFYCSETEKVEMIADSFDEFLKKLY